MGCEAIAGYEDPPAPAAVSAVTGCEAPGDVAFGGHCYFLVGAPRSWTLAASACSAVKAHLATIASSGEDAVARSFAVDAWLGLSRNAASTSSKAAFRWVTAEAPTFDGWRNGEPNGSGACARATSSGWADVSCAAQYPALCERE